MSEKTLSEIAHIFSGTDYKRNPPGGTIPIYGTGGLMGYTSIALYKGPAVLSGRKGSINNPMYVEGDFWNVDTIFCIKTNDGVDTKWLFYNFLNTDLTKLIEATGVPSVNSRSLYRLKFKWFEFPEQQRIAKILSTADAVIEKTQAAIAKYKAIKQGMLQDLFTRGLLSETVKLKGEKGEEEKTIWKLRPRYEDAPHLYKESKLGWIPKEWDIDRLQDTKVDILDGDRGVNYPKENDFTDSGYCLFLSATNVTKNGFKFSTMQFISKERDELLGNGKLVREDIVVTTRGTIGNVVYYDEKVPYDHIRINSGMIILRNNDSKISNEYLYHFIKEILFEIHFRDSVSGTAQPQLPIKDLKKLFLIYPNPDEQNLIAERIKAINKKLQTEQAYLQKMQLLKKGLMEDLLSGKKQVTVVSVAEEKTAVQSATQNSA